ncbi:MAG TPA: hypothetical protein VKB51_03800 [bacterium]|nr:hypothetical protein [bacterium]
MLDGIKLERAGIPAVSIVTHLFVETGVEMAASHGVPDYKFLVTPHPIANLSEEQLDATADRLTGEVVEFLQSTGDQQ